MKLTPLSMLLLAAPCWCSGQQGPVLAVSQGSCAPGQTTFLELRISGGTAPCGGASATLLFPAGIVPTQIAAGSLLSGGDAEVYWQLRPEASGGVRLALAAGAGSNAFSAASGTLLSIKVAASAALAQGSYPIAFAESSNGPATSARHAISSANGLVSVPHSVAAGALLVTAGASQDSNGNGIPDDWEIRFFGSITNISAATDADGDGLNDYHEYLSGTHPRDPLSCIALQVVPSALPSFRWYSAANASYDVDRAVSLSDSFFPLATNLPSTPPQNTFTDPSATGRVYFYRVRKR